MTSILTGIITLFGTTAKTAITDTTTSVSTVTFINAAAFTLLHCCC